jgi:sugar O-acyltransferase (sialic acid O-acetyltransferase NeuD family)
MAEPILVLGTGDHALVCGHTAAACGLAVAGYLGRANKHAARDLYVPGDCADAGDVRRAAGRLGTRLAVAGFGDNAMRKQACDAAVEAGLTLPALLHPTATIDPSARLADGVFVGPRALVVCGARIARGALINSGVIVEHDCEVEEFAAVYSGAVLGGRVRIGRLAAVGLGATILPGRAIGEGCVVGAGAVVTADQPPLTVVRGSPAKVERTRAFDEPYVS